MIRCSASSSCPVEAGLCMFSLLSTILLSVPELALAVLAPRHDPVQPPSKTTPLRRLILTGEAESYGLTKHCCCCLQVQRALRGRGTSRGVAITSRSSLRAKAEYSSAIYLSVSSLSPCSCIVPPCQPNPSLALSYVYDVHATERGKACIADVHCPCGC